MKVNKKIFNKEKKKEKGSKTENSLPDTQKPTLGKVYIHLIRELEEFQD